MCRRPDNLRRTLTALPGRTVASKSCQADRGLFDAERTRTAEEKNLSPANAWTIKVAHKEERGRNSLMMTLTTSRSH
jgi:hypothetical protein